MFAPNKDMERDRLETRPRRKQESILQREFLKTRVSSCMLYRHNAAIGTDWNLVFWYNSLYVRRKKILKIKLSTTQRYYIYTIEKTQVQSCTKCLNNWNSWKKIEIMSMAAAYYIHITYVYLKSIENRVGFWFKKI